MSDFTALCLLAGCAVVICWLRALAPLSVAAAAERGKTSVSLVNAEFVIARLLVFIVAVITVSRTLLGGW